MGLTVAPNSGSGQRSAVISVAGQSIPVTQGSTCAKADNSYGVFPFYQAGASYISLNLPVPSWPQQCYNNYSGNCVAANTVIAHWGCTETALAMLLNYASVPNIDPGQLDTFMKNPNTLFDANHDVRIPDTVNALRGRKPNGNLQYIQINGPGTTPDTPDALASALDNGPVLVSVPGSSARYHFAVATGRTCQPDGTYQFSMIDPGHANNTVLGSTFFVRGYVTDPPDLSELTVGFTGLNGFLTSDDLGNQTGFNPQTNNTIQNIPNSHYTADYITDPDTDQQLSSTSYFLDVKQPTDGQYKIVVTGTASAPFTLTVQGYATDGTSGSQSVLSATTAPGSSQTYILTYSSAPGASTSAALVIGDINGDGVVNCSDLDIVKASFGKKVGMPGFDGRADINQDGVVNVLDLAIVAQHLPSSTSCK